MKHRPGQENFQADSLSRSPKPEQSGLDAEVEAVQLQNIERGPINFVQVRDAIRLDPVLARVLEFVQREWPLSGIGDEHQPCVMRLDELTESSVLLWNIRVSVLSSLHEKVLGL